jgi:hypothetical protein
MVDFIPLGQGLYSERPYNVTAAERPTGNSALDTGSAIKVPFYIFAVRCRPYPWVKRLHMG